MTENFFKHKFPIEIRFADIDAFGHVNNARYLTYVEQARISYFDGIVGWDYDWTKQGVILARAEIDFIMPVLFRDQAVVMTRCSRIGNKSFDLQYRFVKMKEGKEILLAAGFTVMVAFDYVNQHSIIIPEDWRTAIQTYEGMAL